MALESVVIRSLLFLAGILIVCNIKRDWLMSEIKVGSRVKVNRNSPESFWHEKGTVSKIRDDRYIIKLDNYHTDLSFEAKELDLIDLTFNNLTSLITEEFLDFTVLVYSKEKDEYFPVTLKRSKEDNDILTLGSYYLEIDE